jgi:hypothetical protein
MFFRLLVQASTGMSSVKAGFRKHVIPTLACAMAWDLCFLKPSYKAFAF